MSGDEKQAFLDKDMKDDMFKTVASLEKKINGLNILDASEYIRLNHLIQLRIQNVGNIKKDI